MQSASHRAGMGWGRVGVGDRDVDRDGDRDVDRDRDGVKNRSRASGMGPCVGTGRGF